MIGLDTNILARYYIDDASDKQSLAQRNAAKSLIDSGQPLMVCKTVLLEFEWVMRGYYKLTRAEIFKVMQHIMSMRQVTIEDRELLVQALSNATLGLDLAHAIHHASYRNCSSVASFDDKQFARKSRHLSLNPRVFVPTS
jgi:predicted nucleic-acid-binding protein